MNRRDFGEAGLMLVVVLLAVLTVTGIALNWVTHSERVVAAHEWSASRALYAADAGTRWASEQMRTPTEFLKRPEFRNPPDPFGSVRFPMPAHRHGALGPFTGDPTGEGIQVDVQTPSYLGRRPCMLAAPPRESGRFFYLFEVRVRASENGRDEGYAKQIAADVEVGPLPSDFLEVAQGAGGGPGSPGGDIIANIQLTGGTPGICHSGILRSVIMNWREL